MQDEDEEEEGGALAQAFEKGIEMFSGPIEWLCDMTIPHKPDEGEESTMWFGEPRLVSFVVKSTFYNRESGFFNRESGFFVVPSINLHHPSDRENAHFLSSESLKNLHFDIKNAPADAILVLLEVDRVA